MSEHHDKYSIDNTDYTVGQDNVQKWGFDVHNPVFGISAGLIALFLVATLISDAETAKTTLNGIKNDIINNFDGFFMWSANLFVLFCLALIVSPYGNIRLGVFRHHTEQYTFTNAGASKETNTLPLTYRQQ